MASLFSDLVRLATAPYGWIGWLALVVLVACALSLFAAGCDRLFDRIAEWWRRREELRMDGFRQLDAREARDLAEPPTLSTLAAKGFRRDHSHTVVDLAQRRASR